MKQLIVGIDDVVVVVVVIIVVVVDDNVEIVVVVFASFQFYLPFLHLFTCSFFGEN